MPSQEQHVAEGSKRTLEECESVIRSGLKTFVEVLEIRGRRLYRYAGFRTFEKYCRERWGWSKTHANRQIAAAEVVRNLAPIGVKLESEAQAGALAALAPEEQRRIAAQTDFRQTTARQIKVQASPIVAQRLSTNINATRLPELKPDAPLFGGVYGPSTGRITPGISTLPAPDQERIVVVVNRCPQVLDAIKTLAEAPEMQPTDILETSRTVDGFACGNCCALPGLQWIDTWMTWIEANRWHE